MGRIKNIDSRIKHGEVVMGGGTIHLLRGLSLPRLEWLCAQIPDDGTMIELLRAIINDAYDDAHSDELEKTHD